MRRALVYLALLAAGVAGFLYLARLEGFVQIRLGEHEILAHVSVALMLRHTFHMDEAARRVEHAYEAALSDGIRTGDLAEPGAKKASTMEFTDAVLERLEAASREASAVGGAR